jgi:hypothetical protein
MRRGRWAAIAAASVVVAAAVVTAGCGGGSSNALSLDPVAAAATKTEQAGAARIHFDLTFSTPEVQGGKMLRLQGAGAIDGSSSELTVGGLSPIFQQSGIPAGASLKEISLEQNGDYVLYLQLGALAALLPGGQHWIELDLSKLGSSGGLDLGKLLSGSQVQPSDLLSMLKAEGAKISKVGPATVHGAATTHYRVTIDVAKALQAKGLTSPLLAGIAAQKPMVPEDVWIGKDGLVHRIRISFDGGKSHTPLQLGMTMDIYDYGIHVSIAAPPSSDVFDATQFAQQGFGSTLH